MNPANTGTSLTVRSRTIAGFGRLGGNSYYDGVPTRTMVDLAEVEAVLQAGGAYAAIVYGSYARGEDYNDVDVAVFTDGGLDGAIRELPTQVDLHRFQDLPMYVRHRVLAEGERLFCTDEDRFYDTVLSFVRAYEDYRPLYEEYLEGVKAGG